MTTSIQPVIYRFLFKQHPCFRRIGMRDGIVVVLHDNIVDEDAGCMSPPPKINRRLRPNYGTACAARVYRDCPGVGAVLSLWSSGSVFPDPFPASNGVPTASLGPRARGEPFHHASGRIAQPDANGHSIFLAERVQE